MLAVGEGITAAVLGIPRVSTLRSVVKYTLSPNSDERSELDIRAPWTQRS